MFFFGEAYKLKKEQLDGERELYKKMLFSNPSSATQKQGPHTENKKLPLAAK